MFNMQKIPLNYTLKQNGGRDLGVHTWVGIKYSLFHFKGNCTDSTGFMICSLFTSASICHHRIAVCCKTYDCKIGKPIWL